MSFLLACETYRRGLVDSICHVTLVILEMVQREPRGVEGDEEESRFLRIPSSNSIAAAKQFRHHLLAIVLDRVPIRDELQNIVRESCSEVVYAEESYGFRMTGARSCEREDVEEEYGGGKEEEMASPA